MNEKTEDLIAPQAVSGVRWRRILIGCLLGTAFAVSLGCLRYFNAIHSKDMGIAIGLSIAEFVVCVAIAIFVEHRRLVQNKWREKALEFERRQNASAEAERWKNEVQSDLMITESEIRRFKKNVELRINRSTSIDELKKVARKAVRDGYNSGMAIVRNIEIKGGAQ
jgi:hypothetical protein